MIVVTTGKGFTDIDGYACVIALNELNKLQNINSQAVILGPFNASVTPTVKNWPAEFSNEDSKQGKVVIVDTSSSESIKIDWGIDRVEEIFDHHYGYERYWQDRLGSKSHIEPVGACATQIWEEWIKAKKDHLIDEASANLLYTAILSNTLNFNAGVTTQRDIQAYKQLSSHIDLPSDWASHYFSEVESESLTNPYNSLINDTKIITFPNIKSEWVFGQLELWDAKKFISQNMQQIETAMKSFGKDNWLFSAPSISEGKNYLVSPSKKIHQILSQSIGANFNDEFVTTTSKLLLRKEIIREIQKL